MPELFDSVIPTAGQRETIETLRQEFAKLADLVDAAAAPSRRRSLALTNLEESCMWAIKAVTHGE